MKPCQKFILVLSRPCTVLAPINSILLILLILSVFPATMSLHAQTRDGRPLDSELLKNLKNQSKTDIERELFGTGNKDENEKFKARAGQGRADLGVQLQRELGSAAEKEDDNPMLIIARNMFQVRQRIKQTDAGPATVNMQKQIVADLDQLIDQAKKACCQGSSSASNSQNSSSQNPKPSNSKPPANAAKKPGDKPATGSSPQTTPAEKRKPDMEETRSRMKNLWGELPPHMREQIQQAPAEDFVPKYELQIEDYYRDLSNEKKTGE